MKTAIFAAATLAAATALATPALGQSAPLSVIYHATLSGANEIGGGDPDGSGKAEIKIMGNYDKVCFKLSDIANIGPIVAAHVHHGVVGANGPPVFSLSKSADGSWQGCQDGASWEKNRINGDPQDFYVNVHTKEFPGGAIRGQLAG